MFDRTFKSLVILVLLVLIVPALGHAVTSSEIEAELMCDCGCGDMLVNCTCERSEEMRAIITGMINQGKSKTQILGLFVAQQAGLDPRGSGVGPLLGADVAVDTSRVLFVVHRMAERHRLNDQVGVVTATEHHGEQRAAACERDSGYQPTTSSAHFCGGTPHPSVHSTTHPHVSPQPQTRSAASCSAVLGLMGLRCRISSTRRWKQKDL